MSDNHTALKGSCRRAIRICSEGSMRRMFKGISFPSRGGHVLRAARRRENEKARAQSLLEPVFEQRRLDLRNLRQPRVYWWRWITEYKRCRGRRPTGSWESFHSMPIMSFECAVDLSASYCRRANFDRTLMNCGRVKFRYVDFLAIQILLSGRDIGAG